MKGVRCVNCVVRVWVLRDLNTFMLLFLYFYVYSSVLLPGMMKGEPVILVMTTRVWGSLSNFHDYGRGLWNEWGVQIVWCAFECCVTWTLLPAYREDRRVEK